jgi:transglutaminase-like putative cysteine protease
MSRLYCTEEGRVISTLGEELTRYRHARKVLDLPATDGPVTVFLLARPHAGFDGPLRMAVNAQEVPPVPPGSAPSYLWYEAALDPDLLRVGKNAFELWTDASSMTGWGLAIEGGLAARGSSVSDDAGATWRSERMGYLNGQIGEYVVRVRLAEGEDPPPPALVHEDPAHPRLAALRQLMPAAAREGGTRLDRVRALSTWLSTSWQHTDSVAGSVYTPWDPETILAWGARRVGHDGRLPVTMCVHYGVAMVMSCQALGIPARCAAFASDINTSDGHFAAEVWFDDLGKWVFVDANADLLFRRDGIPLSIGEIQAAGSDLRELASFGPGADYQRGFPHMASFVEENLMQGLFVRRRAAWLRSDFLSHPERTPPGHGATAYCETGLVWETRDRDRGFGMFPFFGDAQYFDAAPDWPARS